MNATWKSLLDSLPPTPAESRGLVFFDLADPEKRARADILQALDLITSFDGLCTDKPLITTGAGDHFNAGFCLGKLLGFDDRTCLLTGVTTSGFDVRNARTPTAADLVDQIRNWPADHE